MYLMIAAFSSQERNQRTNVFPLTLGPHGSNSSDVIEALSNMMQTLDCEILMNINGIQHFVCVFTLAFTEDMPQQQKNSGFLSQNAKFECQFCKVSAEKRNNLQFDILSHGRFHHKILQQCEHMKKLKTKTRKEAYEHSIDTG